MIDKETTEKEQERLLKMQSFINKTIIPRIDDDFFSENSIDKKSASVDQLYYAGGTLFLDITLGTKKGFVMLNISSEIYSINLGDKQIRGLAPIDTLWFGFMIYKEVKGITDYYKKCYNNSCIRHLYNIDLNKHPADPRFKDYLDKFTDALFCETIPRYFKPNKT